MNKKEHIKRFKERFSDYLNGKDEYLDYVRDRWTNEEVVHIFEYGITIGKLKKISELKNIRKKNGA